MTFQEHENVQSRLQRLMMAQQELNHSIANSGYQRSMSPPRAMIPTSTALYPEPRSPPPREEYVEPIADDGSFSPVLVPVNDEWLMRMEANRLSMNEPAPEPTVERIAVAVPGSPGQIRHINVSPPRSPAPGHYAVSRDGIHYTADPQEQEWVAEAMNRKLSPNMRDRIRKALHRSLLDTSFSQAEVEPPSLSPTTRDLLRSAYEAAADAEELTNHSVQSSSPGSRRAVSHRVLYDVIYGKLPSGAAVPHVPDQTEPEFAEFRGWLDRIFDEPQPVQRAVLSEVLDRVRSAWRGKDTTRLDRQSVQQIRRAIEDANQAGLNGKRHLYSLVETESDGNTVYGTETQFEQWLHSIFGEFSSASPPRSRSPNRSSLARSSPPRSRAEEPLVHATAHFGGARSDRQWSELERPLFQKKPKPVIASAPRAVAEPGASPWGEPWQPSSETSDVYGPSTASLFSIAAAGELAVEELNRQGHFDQYLPRRERWRAPDTNEGAGYY